MKAIKNIKPPANLIPWLTYTGFLTAKLKKISSNVSMKICRENWEEANYWDNNKLKINDETVLHREIIMLANDNLCWYARTILPESTFKNHPKLFARLENELLGNLLFDETENITRTKFIYYALDHESLEYSWIKANLPTFLNGQILWMRLSTFSVKNNGDFFLAEIFLPGLLELIDE